MKRAHSRIRSGRLIGGVRLTVVSLLAAVSAHADRIVFVDPDAPGPRDGSGWAWAYRDLKTALNLAFVDTSVTEIRVAEGVYLPTDDPFDRDATFTLRSGLTLKGSFAGYGAPSPNFRYFGVTDSVLSGDLLGNDGDLPFSNCCYRRLNESGCDQPECEATVCAVDPDCCSERAIDPDAWWDNCVALAESLCGDLCTFNDENTQHVVSGLDVDETAVLDGFVVEGGSAVGVDFFDGHGGGLLIRGGNPTINHCTFRRNLAGYGAAAYLIDASTTSFYWCRFRGNFAESWAGAVYNRRSSSRFDGCSFDHNFADVHGGAVVNDENSFPFFHQCTFYYNRTGSTGHGGAMINTDNSRSDVLETFFGVNEAKVGGAVMNYPYDNNGGRFVQCIFVGNRATGRGGAIGNSGDLDLINCLIVFNEASDGAGIYHGFEGTYTLRVVQSTLFGNRAERYGGGISHSSALGLQLHNSILWSNTAQPGERTESAQLRIGEALPEVMYTAIEGWSGGFGGVGNSGADPQFRDLIGLDGEPTTGDVDLRLHPDSPYIDGGSNEFLPADELDLDDDGDLSEPLPLELLDRTRVRDGDGDGEARVDLGAYEYQATRLGDADYDDDIDLDDLFYVVLCLDGPRVQLVGDFDGSRHVNLVDYAMWNACVDASGVAPLDGCEPMDVDSDGDIDLADFAVWSRHIGKWLYVSRLCEPLDMDEDFDVDLRDVSLWAIAFSEQD